MASTVWCGCPGGHELFFTNPEGLAEKIIEAGRQTSCGEKWLRTGDLRRSSQPLSLVGASPPSVLKSVDKRRCNTLLRSLVPLYVGSRPPGVRAAGPVRAAGVRRPTVVRMVLTSCGVRVTVQSDVTSRRHRDECQSVSNRAVKHR